MPDDRVIESMFDRALEGLALLTRQVSRAAFALERITRSQLKDPAVFRTCSTCQSTIQKHDVKQCLACGEFMGNG